jgi:twitching motility protein PilT
MLDINRLLARAVKEDASDIHLRANSPPLARIHGKMIPLKDLPPLTTEDTANVSSKIMSLQQKKVFKECHDVDLSYALEGLARFRVNVFQERGATGIVFRTIDSKIKTVQELGLPPVLCRLAREQRGIILVTGATGSGKSTTLAAMIDEINRYRECHILTIEDPIEFVHENVKALVTQREVGADTESFNAALRAALRQDPDVILIGEIRDRETVEISLKAAETGHLVLSTLHTIDATDTINRILSFYPIAEQAQLRIALASVLRSTISQRLLRKKAGGRVAALEIMITTERIKDLIKKPERTAEIKDAIEQGASQYQMQSFDQAIYLLEKRGTISREEALIGTTNPDEYLMKMEGFASTAEGTLDALERAGPLEEEKKMSTPQRRRPSRGDDDPFDRNPFRS